MRTIVRNNETSKFELVTFESGELFDHAVVLKYVGSCYCASISGFKKNL